MRTRRALLVFALVLGVSALAASLNPPRPEREPPPLPAPRDAEAAAPVLVRIDAASEDEAKARVRRGRRAIVTVRVPSSGAVAIEGLGLSGTGDARTPAVFDLFATEPGRFAITFRPVQGRERRLGSLTIVR